MKGILSVNETRLTRYLYRLLILFPITTVLQNAIFENLNKILFACIFCLLIKIHYINKKISNKEIIVCFFLILNYIYALLKTKFPLVSINDLFYMPFLVIYAMFFTEEKKYLINYFRKDKRYIITIIQVWTVIVAISAFLPSSYKHDWGGALYFCSFAGSVFRLAPSALMILVLIVAYFAVYKERIIILYTFVPMFCMYMGGSRTYLGIGLLTFIIIWYMYCSKPKYFYISIVPILIFAILMIFHTAAADKIAATTYTSNSYLDYWATITNGRSIFWNFDLNSFKNENIVNKLLGCGFNYVYEINLKYFNKAIWAHNDFINILLNYGVVGIVLYSYSIYCFFKIMLKNRSNVPVILKILFFFIWFINAMFNMFYTYFCSMISFPILILFVTKYFTTQKSTFRRVIRKKPRNTVKIRRKKSPGVTRMISKTL